ncbi:MAG: hypothetical protein QOF65_2355, partial [Thermoleophilaceae bacterium]|nr:hypothetical protein [Thermoleophilaceae bacterium]
RDPFDATDLGAHGGSGIYRYGRGRHG